MSRPTDPEHFERLYAAHPDPWRFTTSQYECDKYQATVQALGTRRFKRGLEVGCSIGVLSRELADRCDTFLGLDLVQAAVDQAALRCADRPGAAFRRAAVPTDWPEGGFDLVVFSEVLYYLGGAGLAETARACADSLAPGGLAVLVNWMGDTAADMTGEQAADGFLAASGLHPVRTDRTGSYRLDVLAKPQPVLPNPF